MTGTGKIAVIGGGLGGLTAAIALHRQGFDVHVYEKAAELSEIGAGLNLSPNALKTLRALELEQPALDIGCPAENHVVRSFKSGRTIMRQKRKGELEALHGATYITIHRADLLDILANAFPAERVTLNAACTGITTTEDGAAAQFADGSAVEADIIVGADGIHSAVRDSLFGEIEPRFTGCICWRGMVPAEALAPDINRMDLTSWWGPHGHIVHYPVRRGELINFVAHVDSDAWTEESWTHECGVDEILSSYQGWHPSLINLIRSSGKYYKWALYDRDPLPEWGRGRVTLLGDAVHAMLPYMGQGACMAMEDGYVLAAALDRFRDDPGAALAAYQRARAARTTRTVMGSRFRAKENHLASPWGRFKRDLKFALRARFAKDKSVHSGAWLYDYDVTSDRLFEDGYGV